MREMYLQNSIYEKMYMQRVECLVSVFLKFMVVFEKKIDLLQYIVSLVQNIPVHLFDKSLSVCSHGISSQVTPKRECEIPDSILLPNASI